MIEINERSREMIIPADEKLLGCVFDDNVEFREFSMDRYTDMGQDKTEANIRVIYSNANNETGEYVVTDTRLEGDKLIAKWVIERDVVAYAGQVGAALCCRWRDAEENITAEWHVKDNHTFVVGSSIEIVQ